MGKKLKYGGFSLLITAIFLAAIVLFNIFAGILTSRFYLKADLTAMKLFSLSSEAEEVLRNLREDIEVVVLTPTEDDLMTNILQQYNAAAGGRISFRYLDPNLNPNLSEEYPGISAFTEGDVIVKSGRRSKSFNMRAMITQTYDANMEVVQAFNADQELIYAIQYVLNEEVAHAVFIGGHEEAENAALRTMLERYGYECSDVNLVMEEIPEDTDLVIINAPTRDFNDFEIEKLDVYMGSGGNTIVGYDFQTTGLTAFDQYLAEWGVEVQNQLILDYTYNFNYPYFLGARVVGDADTPASMSLYGEQQVAVGLLYGRPIRSVWPTGEQGTRVFSPILTTFETSYAKDGGNQVAPDALEQAEGDVQGPFTVGASVRQSQYDDADNQFDSYMIVLNSGLIVNEILELSTQFNNYMVPAGLLTDLNPYSGGDVYIPAKPAVSAYLEVTPGQVTSVLVILVILVPLAIIIAGILTWRRRKNL